MKGRLGLLIAVLGAMLLAAAAASAELTQRGELRLGFNGSFTPRTLPRDRLAPVAVAFSGSVQSASGGTPPPLQRISIAINRYGKLSTQGLPTCLESQLEQTSTRVALARCRRALVGHGTFLAQVSFPNLAPFPVEGKMLAFNGFAEGRPAILIHIYGWKPVQDAVVLSFAIRHPRRGDYGTVLTAKIPEIASNLGYITNISFSFNRRYSYRGRARSFLSARCAAPAGFPGALFAFARGMFTFANGQTLPVTLARNCHVG